MILPAGMTLLATVCNATSNAVPYALWLARGDEQYLVNLSDALGQTGDSGLTGLACHRDRIYAAVQSGPAGRILILDRQLAPVGVISNPEFADIHSIHVAEDALIVCSTGTRSVIRINISDRTATKLFEFDANCHLNSACFAGASLLVCCHHLSKVVPETVGGGVIDAGSMHVVLPGLGQPHSLLADGDRFLVLDSDTHRLVHFDRYGIRQQQLLSGFPRGIAACKGSLFIASSAGRMISRKSPVVPTTKGFWDMEIERVCIHEVDRVSFQLKAKHLPLVAGFEIYDLLALEDDWPLDPPPERLVVPNIHAMARAYYEATKRALAQIH